MVSLHVLHAAAPEERLSDRKASSETSPKAIFHRANGRRIFHRYRRQYSYTEVFIYHSSAERRYSLHSKCSKCSTRLRSSLECSKTKKITSESEVERINAPLDVLLILDNLTQRIEPREAGLPLLRPEQVLHH
jgi:hypothetical protein